MPTPAPLPTVESAVRTQVAKLFTQLLYPYQLDYVTNRAIRKYALWARGLGKSHAVGGDTALTGWSKPGVDQLLVSASDKQAQLLLRKVVWWGNLVDGIVKKMSGKSIYATPPSKSEVIWWNESRVSSHPANPLTAAGHHGPVCWDEVSKTLNDDVMWEALYGVVADGPWPFRMTGTPYGARGIFWKVCTGQIPGWVGSEVTIHDAVRMGIQRDIEDIRSQYDSLSFAQEFECKFLSKELTPFTADLIRLCVDLDVIPPPVIGQRALTGQMPRWAVGIDVGRTNDRTSVVWGCECPTGYFQATRVEHLHGVEFQSQFDTIKGWIGHPAIERVAIDAGGLGMQLAEDLRRAFPGKVQPVTFTNDNKSGMVSLALARMESGHVKLHDPDADLLSDLSAIQRKVLPSGRVQYEAQRTEKGHGDSAWAFLLMLAQLAGQTNDMQIDMGLDEQAFANGVLDLRGAIELETGMGKRPLAQFTAPLIESSSFWSLEDLQAMSQEEKAAYGLLEEATAGIR